MKKILKKLFRKLTCSHKWYVHKEVEVYDYTNFNTNQRPIKIKQTLICKKCGKIKNIVV